MRKKRVGRGGAGSEWGRWVVGVLAYLIALFAAGCTEWGERVGSGSPWWACKNRDGQCSGMDARLTWVQMDNDLAGSRQALAYALGCHRRHWQQPPAAKIARLREAIARAEDARRRALPAIKAGAGVDFGDPTLGDFVAAALAAERSEGPATAGCRGWPNEKRWTVR